MRRAIIKNTGNKIIGINGGLLLPDETVEAIVNGPIEALEKVGLIAITDLPEAPVEDTVKTPDVPEKPQEAILGASESKEEQKDVVLSESPKKVSRGRKSKQD